ncbi:MAG: ABC transporter ATP-binding protein [Candidatus Omnitrophica bacterium]|nr:ABC transporter ATP-binding protein [Candidatus Omnitrophota bacterium]
MMSIKVTNVHKTYRQAGNILHVLKGVSFEIAEGEILGLVGPSGAGKSTLLHILGGLDKPTQGEVEFFGQNMYALSDERRAKLRNEQIGFVFQFYHLLPELTALENVILPALVKNNSRKTGAIELDGVKLLEQVGLGGRVTHRPSQLSGGEQQRVAIARALMNGPKVVLCDEPTGNLDSASGAMVMDILLGLNARAKQTVVIVTHDEKIARRVGRVINIRDGGIER